MGVGLYHVGQLAYGFLDIVAEVHVDVAHVLMPPFIHVDDGVEQALDAFARPGHDGHHRNAYHLAQHLVVKLGA